MTTALDTETCPRTAALMAGLAVAAGDREVAWQWFLELLAWAAFDSGHEVGTRRTPHHPVELRC